MPVFLQFRMWLAHGSVRERVLAGSAAAIAILLLVLVSLPLTDDDSTGQSVSAAAPGTGGAATGASTGGAGGGPGATGTGAAAPGAAPSTGAGGTGVAGQPAAGTTGGGGGTDAAGQPLPDGSEGGDAASGGGGGAAAASDACGNLTDSAPGITAKEVTIAASLVDLAGPVGNAAFNIREDMPEIVDAVVADINDNGGVACGRKLVVRKYNVNPIDENDQQAKCLQMVQDGVFSVVDMAGYARPVGRTCFVQNKLPHQVSTSSTNVDLEKGYPFLYGEIAPSEKQGRDGILGLSEVGFFSPPAFKKLGLLVDTCDPSVVKEIEANLAKVGIKAQQISKFTINCALVAPPNEVLQGVVQHKGSGVTHVFLASSLSNNQRYTTLARQQDFDPVFGVSDYGTATSSAGTWDQTFDGAIGVTSTRRGEVNSGEKNARIQACERIITEAGLEGIADEKNDGSAFSICDALWFWEKAIDKAGPNPTRESLVTTGVGTIGLHESGGGSDGNFDRPGKVAGGDFYRFLQFDAPGCGCWKLRDPVFKPGH